LTENHYLYDLVYNPDVTLFLRNGRENGAHTLSGKRMLHLQADRAWEIWQAS
jgi:shikimate dehydrogenase